MISVTRALKTAAALYSVMESGSANMQWPSAARRVLILSSSRPSLCEYYGSALLHSEYSPVYAVSPTSPLPFHAHQSVTYLGHRHSSVKTMHDVISVMRTPSGDSRSRCPRRRDGDGVRDREKHACVDIPRQWKLNARTLIEVFSSKSVVARGSAPHDGSHPRRIRDRCGLEYSRLFMTCLRIGWASRSELTKHHPFFASGPRNMSNSAAC
ncbi:hypothetical protein OBBRIDRAFT_241295 [Obba rivulosa]|uniref:Uncharacterized protein n=1 Tax=Obba rivulosa TaxID=1052685 RepID=A0A8E2DFW4_9APHY|nr:hypothetical protein OBBRIDRAFT_241295 [Obba rivulosa]